VTQKLQAVRGSCKKTVGSHMHLRNIW